MRELPNLLHIAWMGPDPMERKMVQILESTKSVLSGFQLKIWNNNTFGEIFTSGDKSFGSFLEAATATKNWQAVNDFVKVFVSVKYGGWVADSTDEFVFAPKPFTRMPFVSGFGSDDGKLSPFSSVWGAVPQHKFSRLMLTAYTRHSSTALLSSRSIEWVSRALISSGAKCEDTRQYVDKLDVHLFPSSIVSSQKATPSAFVVSHRSGVCE